MICRRLLLLLTLGAALAAGGCGARGGAGDDGRIRVVVSTTQLGDLVRNVGGPAVDVHPLLHPNSDPHDYEPRPRDILAAADADVVVTSGDGLDAWMDEILRNAGGHPRTLDAGAGRPVVRTGRDGRARDPHWWHDPRNVLHAIDRIRATLVAADPAAGPRIARTAAAYAARIRALDRRIRRCVATIPAPERKLVTDHDALGYFAARYGLRVIGTVIPSQTSQAQPSAGDVAALTALIRREHVRAIFPESSVNPRLVDAIARQTGATADHSLYGDTLGPAGSPGATYLGMEQANADRIVDGLTGGAHRCRAPVR